ncbi:MAG TPA: glycoside hydrolase family 2 TIM barrel-domain containing protein [Blastocatellia bacterium]|nr:glycoside hydrolase family 2 TIM barrel-domain containing protein [Blastocatellia bacterium]
MREEPTGNSQELSFRLGINYWPATTAFFWWQRFNPSDVERDFGRIREAGFDSVRIFLLWEDFQPAPNRISRDTVSRLRFVADCGFRLGLSLIPTFFTGHMSGANWIPPWALASGSDGSRFPIVSGGRVVAATIRNWYTDEDIARAQELLIREIVGSLRDHPAIWAWDLGNESSNCVQPPSPTAAVDWLERMAATIRQYDPHRPITVGLHAEDLEEDRRLGPAEAGRVCDFLSMHGYPVYARWAEGPTDARVLPFLALLTRWLGRREVLFEEFGAPTSPPEGEVPSPVPLLREEEASQYTDRALMALHDVGCMGAMLWCYSDYVQDLWGLPPLDRAPHERWFGLWRADGTPKAAVKTVSSWKGKKRRPPQDDFSWIDIQPDTFTERPGEHLPHLYSRFCVWWSKREGAE